jgi:hypothetical protein
MELPLDILNQPVMLGMTGLRSTSKNVVYFGKLEARARETKAEITEVRARMQFTSVNCVWRSSKSKMKLLK